MGEIQKNDKQLSMNFSSESVGNTEKEEKKEESPTNLANEYLALYQKTDAAPEEWKEMHRRLADYFQQIR